MILEEVFMELVIIISLIIFLFVLKIGLDIKLKDLKRIKELGYDEKLKELTNKLPDNIEICKDMLKIIKNDETKIEESKDEKSTTSLYIAMSNKILIGNIKNTFTSIQTIAHECIHSKQSKVMQKFNFIISNIIGIIYVILIAIILFNKFENPIIFGILLIAYLLLGISRLIVRSYLEIDAMMNAKYLAKDYMESKGILLQDEIQNIIDGYDEINSVGIKFYIFVLILKFIMQIILLFFILMLFPPIALL